MLGSRNTQETEDSVSDVESIPENPDVEYMEEETHGSTDDNTQYVPTPKKKSRKRAKTSMIWNHVHDSKTQPQYLYCNYCTSKWHEVGRGNSTSTIRTHLLKNHQNKLCEEELASISQFGESSGVSASGESLPPRSLQRTPRPNMALPRSSVVTQDRYLGK